MCLTDKDFQNLPAGDAVDKLLKEWQTGTLQGQTNDHGSFTFHGFLGEYEVKARYGNKTVNSTFALSKGQDTKQIYLHIWLKKQPIELPLCFLFEITTYLKAYIMM